MTRKKKVVSEEQRPQDEWYKRADNIHDLKTFNAFYKELMQQTEHDYGTAVYAVSAVARAILNMALREQDITGFQASFVMWGLVRYLGYQNNKCGMALLDYDNMLYPQYSERFNQELPVNVWENMQKCARQQLTQAQQNKIKAHPDVVTHWQQIVDGVVPFGWKVAEKD